MHNSILLDIKKLIGALDGYNVFDPDLIAHINSELFVLFQLGVGKKPYAISGDTETWEDFCSNEGLVSACKQYVYLRVKAVFDPPSTSFVIQSNKERMNELEWRIRDMANSWIPEDDPSNPDEPDTPDIPDVPELPDGYELATDDEVTSMLDSIFQPIP